MARQYAQIFTEIWRNADFIALERDEQWAYLLLNTQPDISAAGILTIAATRWAKRAPGTPVALIRQLLDRLAAKRFLVVDWETDEVLLRSFIRHDKGHTNPKRRPAIRDAINLVESPTILAAIAAELNRLHMPAPFWGSASAFMQVDSLSDSPSNRHDGTVRSVDTPENGKTSTPVDAFQNHHKVDTTTFSQVDRLSDSHGDSDGPSERRVPLTPNQNPRAEVLFPLATQGGVRKRRTTAQRNADDPAFNRFYAAYPRKKEPVAARKAWDKATRTADPETIIAAAERLAAEGRAPQYTPYPASWLNAGGYADQPDRPATARERGGFDARADEFDQMRDRMRAASTTAALSLVRPAIRELTNGGPHV